VVVTEDALTATSPELKVWPTARVVTLELWKGVAVVRSLPWGTKKYWTCAPERSTVPVLVMEKLATMSLRGLPWLVQLKVAALNLAARPSVGGGWVTPKVMVQVPAVVDRAPLVTPVRSRLKASSVVLVESNLILTGTVAAVFLPAKVALPWRMGT